MLDRKTRELIGSEALAMSPTDAPAMLSIFGERERSLASTSVVRRIRPPGDCGVDRGACGGVPAVRVLPAGHFRPVPRVLGPELVVASAAGPAIAGVILAVARAVGIDRAVGPPLEGPALDVERPVSVTVVAMNCGRDTVEASTGSDCISLVSRYATLQRAKRAATSYSATTARIKVWVTLAPPACGTSNTEAPPKRGRSATPFDSEGGAGGGDSLTATSLSSSFIMVASPTSKAASNMMLDPR